MIFLFLALKMPGQSQISALALALALPALAGAFLPPQNPPWPAAWGMNRSTLSMFCNSSGFFDPVLTSHFGIASFDVR
jgi:hypothetical protein